MKNKILIIGFGKMGLSHFKSFYNKDFIIHIVEKKINQNVIEIKKSDLFEKKFSADFILISLSEKKICCMLFSWLTDASSLTFPSELSFFL